MNLTEVEEALQQINGHLVTKKELQYIYHVCMTRGVEPMLAYCWASVADVGPTIIQHWFSRHPIFIT